jgi:hypothetical protein
MSLARRQAHASSGATGACLTRSSASACWKMDRAGRDKLVSPA